MCGAVIHLDSPRLERVSDEVEAPLSGFAVSFPRKRESSTPQRRRGVTGSPLARAITWPCDAIRIRNEICSMQPDYHSFNRASLNGLDNGNIAQKLQRRDIKIIAKIQY